MSMIARVVEITSDRLSQLVADPSAVEDLFSGDNPSGGSFSGLLMTEAAQERLKKLSSDMLATSLARMDPKGLEVVFDRLKKIRINIDATQSGKAGEAVLGLMKERALGRQRGAQTAFTAPATAASQSNGRLADLSLEKAWQDFIIYSAARPNPTARRSVIRCWVGLSWARISATARHVISPRTRSLQSRAHSPTPNSSLRCVRVSIPLK